MKPLLIPLPGNENLAHALAQRMAGDLGKVLLRRFPDQETYLRFETPVNGRSIALVCTLDLPDDKFLPLLFAAEAARDLKAARVGLIAPYLAYMRQDLRFKPGEAITSNYFAKFISTEFDWLATVDPHLHRHTSLDSIYSIPTRVLHAAPLISDWIQRNVDRPLLIGPDAESEQWISAVAHDAGVPHLVLKKVRRGDSEVDISAPDVAKWRDHTPVLIDDIVSTARTMIETLTRLKVADLQPAICIAVHGIFAGNSYKDLINAGSSYVITANTVPHISNKIDITDLVAGGVGALMSLDGRQPFNKVLATLAALPLFAVADYLV